MDNSSRLALLDRYVTMEPTIYLNAETFDVFYEPCELGVWFYAISRFNKTIDGFYLLGRGLWNDINNGLTMAYIYARILDRLSGMILT